MPVEVTAVKNRPSKRRSRARTARKQASGSSNMAARLAKSGRRILAIFGRGYLLSLPPRALRDTSIFPAPPRVLRTPRSPRDRTRAPCRRPRTPSDSWSGTAAAAAPPRAPGRCRAARCRCSSNQSGGLGRKPNATITASAAMVSSVPGTTSGMRRPRGSGRTQARLHQLDALHPVGADDLDRLAIEQKRHAFFLAVLVVAPRSRHVLLVAPIGAGNARARPGERRCDCNPCRYRRRRAPRRACRAYR